MIKGIVANACVLCCLLSVSEVEGLKRKLTTMLSPANPALQSPWDIGECVGSYWR